MSAYRRKDFQSLLDGSLALTTVTEGITEAPSAGSSSDVSSQRPHRDYQTTGSGLEYYFLGNGLIQGALQHSATPASGTALGLLLMHPEHFSRKSSTFLYHPESGLERTVLSVIVNEKVYHPSPRTLEVQWEYPASIPTVVATWRAGRCTVREEFWCPIGVPALVRTVEVKNNASAPIDVTAEVMLYPNQMFFDEQSCLEQKNMLEARGYLVLRLFALDDCRAHDRWLTASFGQLEKGRRASATFAYSIDALPNGISRKQLSAYRRRTSEYWRSTNDLRSREKLDHLFRTSKHGLRAAISESGKVDSGIWQYNLEWVRDGSMMAVALVMSGQEKLARTMLSRMMEKMVTHEGAALESSRWRGYDLYELDQNGELLYAVWMYWQWTKDDSLIKKYWKKIVALAEFPLRTEFWNAESGLLKNTREYWERSAPYGVREGYELTYQLWPSIGLQKASEMARKMKKPFLAERWSTASEKIRHALLASPKHALIDGGRFIKRRLAKGEVQTVFNPPDRSAMPPGMPLATEQVSYCEPDTQEALPIALEVIPPGSGLARNTMMEIEKLWNQRWDFGGYARYNVTSEPDSPGPWPFPTMFVARAYLEMGDHKKVWRALDWLYDVQGGKAGTWMEYYGNRPVPPLPPTAVVPWTWAELIIFFIHHLLGIRPTDNELVIRPRLISGLREVKARVRVQGKQLSLRIRRGRKKEAKVDGRKIKLTKRVLYLPTPKKDLSIDMTV